MEKEVKGESWKSIRSQRDGKTNQRVIYVGDMAVGAPGCRK